MSSKKANGKEPKNSTNSADEKRKEQIWSGVSALEKGSQAWPWDHSTPVTVRLEQPDLTQFRSGNPPKFVIFTLVLTRGFGVDAETWSLKVRYSMLEALQKEVKDESGITFALPPKRMFGNLKPEFITERRQQLETFLQSLSVHPVIKNSLAVKLFFDNKRYCKVSIFSQNALKEVSMYMRSNTDYKSPKLQPSFGWRFNKTNFIVCNGAGNERVLTWSPFMKNAHSTVSRETLSKIIESLKKLDHPCVLVGEHVSLLDTERGALISVRDYCTKGSLKDVIYGNPNPRAGYVRKYAKADPKKQMEQRLIQKYGRHVLHGLQFLLAKGIPYGQLHSGNVLIANNDTAQLVDLENGLLGYSHTLTPFVNEIKKIQTMEHYEVYSFGHLLYEMVMRDTLRTATLDTIPSAVGGAILESILTTTAVKQLPKLSKLLDDPFFSGENVSPAAYKVPSKLKEHLTTIRDSKLATMAAEQLKFHQAQKKDRIAEEKKAKQNIKDRELNRLTKDV
eukprot:m.15105 g.15105  ORF g.15105 m.15105 type:complete len:506 (-) comp10446_c0_seq1:50-1567(-)